LIVNLIQYEYINIVQTLHNLISSDSCGSNFFFFTYATCAETLIY